MIKILNPIHQFMDLTLPRIHIHTHTHKHTPFLAVLYIFGKRHVGLTCLKLEHRSYKSIWQRMFLVEYYLCFSYFENWSQRYTLQRAWNACWKLMLYMMVQWNRINFEYDLKLKENSTSNTIQNRNTVLRFCTLFYARYVTQTLRSSELDVVIDGSTS